MVWVCSDRSVTAGPAVCVQRGAPIGPVQPSSAAAAFLPTRGMALVTVPNATPVAHRPVGGTGAGSDPPPPPPPHDANRPAISSGPATRIPFGLIEPLLRRDHSIVLRELAPLPAHRPLRRSRHRVRRA